MNSDVRALMDTGLQRPYIFVVHLLEIIEHTAKRSHQEIANASNELFLQTIKADGVGIYEVRLPWLEGHHL